MDPRLLDAKLAADRVADEARLWQILNEDASLTHALFSLIILIGMVVMLPWVLAHHPHWQHAALVGALVLAIAPAYIAQARQLRALKTLVRLKLKPKD